MPTSKKQTYYREWFRTLAAFVDEGARELTRADLVVFLILLRDTRPDGTARAALTDLARRGGMSKRSASRAVQSLIGRGVVRVVRPGVTGKATLYTVLPVAVFKRLNPVAAGWIEVESKVDTDATAG
jgi:DNA-binding MarR family transcriptional regulator